MTFRDRADAGRALADALVPTPAPPAVVPAIPRGRVPVALPLAERARDPHLPGPGVVLLDDGLATGLTMRVALAYARRHGARDVTVAVPCASAQAAGEFERAADRFVSLVVDPEFQAVGQYYLDFSPVPDDEVRAMLACG